MPDFPNGFPRRGEIYWAPLDKVRPVLVVSADQGNKFSNAVVVAGITTKIAPKRYPVNVSLAENDPLPAAGEILCRSLYAMPKDDLKGYRATLRDEQMAAVDRALSVALGLPKLAP